MRKYNAITDAGRVALAALRPKIVELVEEVLEVEIDPSRAVKE